MDPISVRLPSYYEECAALRATTLRGIAWEFWKGQAQRPWFWIVEVALGGVVIWLTDDEWSKLIQALFSCGAVVVFAIAIYFAGLLLAPYIWRRRAAPLLPPFDDATSRALQVLMNLDVEGQNIETGERETAFQALFHLHNHLCVGVTAKECARLLAFIYGGAEDPGKEAIDEARIGFLAELSMLHIVERKGKRFYLTEWGKNFLDKYILYDDIDIAPDGSLIARGPRTS